MYPLLRTYRPSCFESSDVRTTWLAMHLLFPRIAWLRARYVADGGVKWGRTSTKEGYAERIKEFEMPPVEPRNSCWDISMSYATLFRDGFKMVVHKDLFGHALLICFGRLKRLRYRRVPTSVAHPYWRNTDEKKGAERDNGTFG